MNLYYEISGDGYYIKDNDDASFVVHQYPPYTQLYVPNGTLEENAQAQIADLSYVPITDETNTYDIPDDIYHDIIDDYTLELLGGVVNE